MNYTRAVPEQVYNQFGPRSNKLLLCDSTLLYRNRFCQEPVWVAPLLVPQNF